MPIKPSRNLYLFALACVTLLTGSAVADNATRPIIEIKQTTQDGGLVEEGSIVKYRFLVTNRGSADLELKRVKPECGCSIARWDKVVKPGAQSTIEAEMQTE